MADEYDGPIPTVSDKTFAPSRTELPDPTLPSRCEAEAAMWQTILELTSEEGGREWTDSIVQPRVEEALASGKQTSAGLLPIIHSWSKTPVPDPTLNTLNTSAETVNAFWSRFGDVARTFRLSREGKAQVTALYNWMITDGLITDTQVKEDLKALRELTLHKARFQFAEGYPPLLLDSANVCRPGLAPADWQADLASGRPRTHSENSIDGLRTLVKTYLASSLPQHASGLWAFRRAWRH